MLLAGGAIAAGAGQRAEAEIAGQRDALVAQASPRPAGQPAHHHGLHQGQRDRRRPPLSDDCTSLPPVTGALTGVFSVAERDVWAVGASGTIVHYDGCWRAQPSPTSERLSAVWAAPGGVVWAVGIKGLTVRRDAGRWTVAPAPTVSPLNAVWGAAANDVWTVAENAQILHWNGNQWSVVLNRGMGQFSGIWGGASNDVWVVGRGRDLNNDFASLLEHWDGSRWTESYTCNPAGSGNAAGGFASWLRDVSGVQGGSAWAVGRCIPGASLLGFDGLVWRSTGETWGLLGQRTSALTGRPLDAVWARADDDVWAAPAASSPSGSATLIHFDGSVWTPSEDPNTVGISDISGTSASDVWAVGELGKRLHFDGVEWTLSTP